MNKPAKNLYRDQELIASTLRDNGVDPDNEATWHRIKNAEKQAIAASLAENAKQKGIDADASYAWQAIASYFGERRRVASRKRRLL